MNEKIWKKTHIPIKCHVRPTIDNEGELSCVLNHFDVCVKLCYLV